MTKDEVVGWHLRLSGHEFEQVLGDSEGQGSLVGCSPWGRKESGMTELLTPTLHGIYYFGLKGDPLDCKEIQPVHPEGNQS